MPIIPVSPKNQVLLICLLLFLMGSAFLVYKIMKDSENDSEFITDTGSHVITTGGIPDAEKIPESEKIPDSITSSWVVNKPVIVTAVIPGKIPYDSISDSSVTKFVSPSVSYTQSGYAPKGLEKIIPSSTLAAKNIELRKEANTALVAMSKDFQKKFWEKIAVVSGYRSYAYQQGIEERAPECVKNSLCARAGYSEHQSGLAIDIFETSTREGFLGDPRYRKYFEWLNDHAHTYGFTNTYKKWIKIDGYHEEPWHWRYVWRDFATELYLQGISFAEYMTGMR